MEARKDHFEPVPDVGGKGALVRNRIARAALELFGAVGFEGTSSRDIAKRAGVQHSLLLYHFKSKQRLWTAVLLKVIEHSRKGNSKPCSTHSDPTDIRSILHGFIEQHVRFTAEVPQVHRVMTMEQTQGSNRLKPLFDSKLRDHEHQVINLIRRGQAAGIVRKVDPIRLYFAILGITGQFAAVGPELYMLVKKDFYSEAEIRKTIKFISELVFIRHP